MNNTTVHVNVLPATPGWIATVPDEARGEWDMAVIAWHITTVTYDDLNRGPDEPSVIVHPICWSNDGVIEAFTDATVREL